MKTCVKCGTQWPDKANFCPRDGAMLRETITVDPIVDTPAPQEMKAPEPQEKAEPEVEEIPEETGNHSDPGFSETQWFMAAVDPESLKEEAAAPDEVMELQDKYKRDESISEEKRSRFSLRRKKN
jgi:hypothetical protein